MTEDDKTVTRRMAVTRVFIFVSKAKNWLKTSIECQLLLKSANGMTRCSSIGMFIRYEERAMSPGRAVKTAAVGWLAFGLRGWLGAECIADL